MGKKKYYAVRVGEVPGIYLTWDDAKEQVQGYSGGQYKSFENILDAEKYLLGEDNKDEKKDYIEMVNNEIKKEIEKLGPDQVIAFVDGSYSSDVEGEERYGYGAVLITKESETCLSGSYDKMDYMTSRNVAGEIEGVKNAILWAIENKKKEIIVYYDYEGIEKWAKKQWKANKELTLGYRNFYGEKLKLIKVDFRHVKAHSGIYYNEKADELAKKSLYLPVEKPSVVHTTLE
ncbi:MAG: RNase H [Clostridiales bacterium]|nr:RNase H [Clostridiales bacterium]